MPVGLQAVQQRLQLCDEVVACRSGDLDGLAAGAVGERAVLGAGGHVDDVACADAVEPAVERLVALALENDDDLVLLVPVTGQLRVGALLDQADGCPGVTTSRALAPFVSSMAGMSVCRMTCSARSLSLARVNVDSAIA